MLAARTLFVTGDLESDRARRLFSEGALSVAFIPVFTSLVEEGDEKGAQRLANVTLTLLVTLLGAMVLLGEGVILAVGWMTVPAAKIGLTLTLAGRGRTRTMGAVLAAATGLLLIIFRLSLVLLQRLFPD